MADDVKTKKTDEDVAVVMDSVDNEKRVADCRAVMKMMKRVTGKAPKMWGSSIIGFDEYHYVYDSGREGDWPITGLSPRKQSLTLYIMPGFDRYDDLMKKLGKHKTGESCLYINRLEDVNMDVLEELVRESVEYMRNKYH